MTTCAYCPMELTDRSPSEYFCSDGCQDQWHQALAEPCSWGVPVTDEALTAQIKRRLGVAEQDLGGAA